MYMTSEVVSGQEGQEERGDCSISPFAVFQQSHCYIAIVTKKSNNVITKLDNSLLNIVLLDKIL